MNDDVELRGQQPIGRRRALQLGGLGLGSAAAGFGVRAATESSFVTPGQLSTRSNVAPEIVERRGSSRIIWSVNTAAQRVAITFDDGPDPDFTPRALAALAAVGGRGTFFMMGYNVETHAELARRVVNEGHEIATHTSEHRYLPFLAPADTGEQIADGFAAVKKLGDVRWFRPPRGGLTGAVVLAANDLDLDIAMWSVNGRIGKDESSADLAIRIGSTIQRGDIVLFHDGIGRGTFQPQTSFAQELRDRRGKELDALPRVLEQLTDSGFELVTVSELVGDE